jgi:hypothetical protein
MQPGVGYRFSSSSQGVTLDIGEPWETNTNPVPCPLQIYSLRYDTNDDAYYINVSPGMVNNYQVQDYDDNPLTDVPTPNIQVFVDGITTEYTTNYIYIACDNSGSPDYLFPDPSVPPYLWVTDAPDVSDNDTGLLLIGIVKGKTSEDELTDTLEIYNYKGCGSLWAELFKCGSSNVTYWWSAV